MGAINNLPPQVGSIRQVYLEPNSFAQAIDLAIQPRHPTSNSREASLDPGGYGRQASPLESHRLPQHGNKP